MLPPPSPEQTRVLDHFRAGTNVVVTAVAGAGKSTLLLHACAAFPDEEVVVLAYNAPLAAEMNELLAAAGLVHARAYTFHSLTSQVFRLCPDDNTMYEIVEEAHRNGAQPRRHVAPKHLLLDEMQDMRDLYWELLSVVFDLQRTHTLICGDPEQMLYDFELDDPAKLDYLQRPADFFASEGEWAFERLSVSFRLTPPVATLVNALKDGEPLVAGNVLGPRPPPLVVTCGMFDWTDKLLPILTNWLSIYPPSKIAILARTVRTAHPAVRKLVNSLVRANVPLYVHGVDAAHARVREGKVTVATYYAAKGLTFEACITLGAAEGVEANPMYVAASRSRCRQVLVLDRMRPPPQVLGGLRSGTIVANTCRQTKDAITYGVEKPKELAGRSALALNDVTGWEPRGRAPEVHAAIGTVVVSQTDVEALPGECFAEVSGVGGATQDEVADVYVLAALMCEEHAATGRCQRLGEVLAPTKASQAERRKRARDGDGTRLVDDKARTEELFPERLRRLVRALHERLSAETCGDSLFFPTPPIPPEPNQPDTPTPPEPNEPDNEPDDESDESDDVAPTRSTPLCARTWCATAVAAIAFGHYHHRAERLLPCLEWVDEGLFSTLRSRLRTRCLSTDRLVHHDCMIRHIGAQTVTQYRCPLLVDDGRSKTAWLVVFAEHLGPNVRVKACVPAAISDDVTECSVLNLRTGETQTYTIPDRAPLRRRMELVA